MSRKKINKVGIYKITNIINNKIYIGQSKEIRKRWLRHIKELNDNKHVNRYLQRAWDKYGEENFKFEIIEECNKSDLNDRERYWIKFYKSNNFKNGYNCDDGGSKGKTVNKDVAIKRAKKRIYTQGEDTPQSKLTNNQVLEIKKLLYEGILSCTEIGNIFCVTKHIILNIKKGKTYTNVKTPLDEDIKNIKSKGSNNKARKLTDEDINNIKRMFVNDENITIQYIADIFNVNSGTISSILHERINTLHPTIYDNLVKEKLENRRPLNNNKKLTKEDVIQIKKTLYENKYTLDEVANMFEINKSSVVFIKNGNKWASVKTEYDDIIKNMYTKKGTDNYKSILKEEDIIEIKKLLAETNLKYKEIGDLYDVSESYISHIKSGETWSHIKTEYDDAIKEKFGKNILSKSEVIEIKKSYIEGINIKDICGKFNVSKDVIYDLLNNRTYRNIKTEYDDDIREKLLLKQQYGAMAKLTKEDVINIKKYLYYGELSLIDIANMYNVNKETIARIKNGKTWVNVASEYNELIKQKQIKSKQSA